MAAAEAAVVAAGVAEAAVVAAGAAVAAAGVVAEVGVSAWVNKALEVAWAVPGLHSRLSSTAGLVEKSISCTSSYVPQASCGDKACQLFKAVRNLDISMLGPQSESVREPCAPKQLPSEVRGSLLLYASMILDKLARDKVHNTVARALVGLAMAMAPPLARHSDISWVVDGMLHLWLQELVKFGTFEPSPRSKEQLPHWALFSNL